MISYQVPAKALDSSVYAGTLMAPASAAASWFAVQTMPRHEKAVAAHFDVRQVESFLPLYGEVHRWRNGCHVPVEQPLFPGYLFTRIARSERARVLSTPGVVTLVGAGRVPIPISDFEIESLRSGLHLRTFEPHPYLIVGRKCRIKTGALAGMSGILVRKKNKFRVVLALDLIMKSVAVEVDIGEVEAIGSGN